MVKMAVKIRNKKLVIGITVAFFTICLVSLYRNYFTIPQEVTDFVIEEKETQNDIPILEKRTLLVFGDVMLDRYIRKYITASGTQALFKYVQEDINKADATLINLEGPITDYLSIVSKDNLQFTFAAHTAQDLADIGIDVVSLANNHTHNFGKEGLRQTREYLHKAGITYFGDPYNNSEKLFTRYLIGSTTISFVGFHQFENPELADILSAIAIEKSLGNYVIFFPHWGTEYEKQANIYQEKVTQKVFEAGADIVIGAHPHVIQNIDINQKKLVFYSLGNFIFDQWFSEDVKYGLALLLTFTENKVESVELKPFYRNRYQPQWLIDEERIVWCESYTKNIVSPEQNNPCLLML